MQIYSSRILLGCLFLYFFSNHLVSLDEISNEKCTEEEIERKEQQKYKAAHPIENKECRMEKKSPLKFTDISSNSVSTSLIPREALFRKASCLAIKISPNGTKLAYIGANKDGVMDLYVCEGFLKLESAKKCTQFKDPGIKGFHWCADSKNLLFLKDSSGTSQFHLYCYDSAACELTCLTKQYSNINTKFFYVSANENKALVGINARNRSFHDLYLVDVNKKSLSLYYQNDQFINFVFDDSLHIVLKVRMNEDGSHTYIDKDDKEFFTVSCEDAFQTECLRYDEKEKNLFLVDTRASNTTQLKKITLDEKKQETLLGHDLLSDIDEVLFEKEKIVAYATYYTHKTWHALNNRAKIDLDYLSDKIGQNFSIPSQTNDGTTWIVTNSKPESGNEFWLYNRVSKDLSLLYSFPNIDNMAHMYPLVLTAKDGMKLVSYLTLPRQSDCTGTPSQPLPLVVFPHGGPFKVRDSYDFSPYHQWLANRGYAVLSVNFRLSSGFGKNHVNAGNGQWGRKAHQDILDAIEWCINSKIALRDKIAVFGGSYGGYEALASLTFSPDVFVCGVAICGPSSLKTVLKNVPFYWEFPAAPLSDSMNYFTKNAFITSMGGNPDKEREALFLESCSPLNNVDKIQKPLLLIHGANDHIVKVSESDQIFETMKQKKLPAIYISFSDEGHGIAKFANSMCYLAYSEWMLAKYLGGRYEPIQEKEFKLSSANIQSSEISHREVVILDPQFNEETITSIK